MLLLATGLAIAAPAGAVPAGNAVGDPVRGLERYEAICGGCHSIEADRIGPRHRGVVGRKAGSIAGFAYSPALKKARLVWTPAVLDRWLQGPPKLVPGTFMGIAVSDPADRRDIIAYLATQSVAKP